ncbi:unnamed protein product [Rhizophagus irregularis]|nr:unnamed protein product [Rhizophagus irregularis]
MSDNTEFEVINNSKELFNQIEEAIVTNHFKQYEYKNFNNIKEIDSGDFIKVYRASWKNSNQYVTLKYFFKLNNTVVEEIIREIKLYRDDYFHNNIIRFHGITKSESENYDVGYWLVMEYADGGVSHRDLHSNSLREKIIPDTPEDYVNIYSECWNNEPDDRPTIKQYNSG